MPRFLALSRSGDLNFRLEQTREVIVREVKDSQTSDDPASVLDFDQLNFLRREGLIFRGFKVKLIKTLIQMLIFFLGGAHFVRAHVQVRHGHVQLRHQCQAENSLVHGQNTLQVN